MSGPADAGRRVTRRDVPSGSGTSYFALIWLATWSCVLGAATTPSWPVRVTAAALLVAAGPAVRTGRAPRCSRQDRRRARALSYLGALMALFLPSAVLVGETRLIDLRSRSPAVLHAAADAAGALTAVAVINLAPVAGWALLVAARAAGRLPQRAVRRASSWSSRWLSASVINRIIEQSQERAGSDRGAGGQPGRGRPALRASAGRWPSASGWPGRSTTPSPRASPASHADPGRRGRARPDCRGPPSSGPERTARREPRRGPRAGRRRHPRRWTARRCRTPCAGWPPGSPRRRRRRRSRPRSRAAAAGHRGGAAARLPGGARRTCRKHAGRTAAVAIDSAYADDERCTLVGRDDGRGFDPGAAGRLRPAGCGPAPTEVGGTVRVRSAPGGGTTVTVRLPVPQPGGAAHDPDHAGRRPPGRPGGPARRCSSAEPDLEVVGEASSGPQAEALAAGTAARTSC